VVTLFMPALFDRNLLDNRPHLGGGLAWQPPGRHWRLTALLRWLIPYRRSVTIEQGIARTRDSLRALVDLARARGAEPLIVVPQFGPESATDEMRRRRILDDTRLPYVHVILDPSWHLLGDLHPDPRAAQAIAIAVAGRLHSRYADGMLGFFREKQAFKVVRRGVLAQVPADRLNLQAMVPVVAMLDPRSAFQPHQALRLELADTKAMTQSPKGAAPTNFSGLRGYSRLY
jgi:hypothetical protein